MTTTDPYDDPAYEAYLEESARRHEAGQDYPIGDMLPCYQCPKVGRGHGHAGTAPLRRCTGEGPVVNRADPTQTYRLECGHVTI